jgi:alpha-beta hydrolase superfamily lysophospholipase
VAEQYRRAGIAEVSCHFYPGARHETLNETNREEVYADVVAWLGRHTAPAVR